MSSDQTTIPIDPPAIKVVRSAISSYSIFRINIVPNVSANIGITLLDENKNSAGVLALTMEGGAYEQWTTDDYLLSWIEQQIYLLYPPNV